MTHHLALIASIKLSNNGRIFAPTLGEVAVAKAHPDLFTLSAPVIGFNGLPVISLAKVQS